MCLSFDTSPFCFTRYSLLISNYLGSCHRIVYNNVMKMKSICKAVISVYVKVYVPFYFLSFSFYMQFFYFWPCKSI